MPHRDQRHPVAAAAEWVAQITAISLEIVIFIWLGRWLDGKLGTSYWAPIGLVVGPVIGFWHLLSLTKVGPRSRSDRDEDPDS